jgi:hypothetical protein
LACQSFWITSVFGSIFPSLSRWNCESTFTRLACWKTSTSVSTSVSESLSGPFPSSSYT